MRPAGLCRDFELLLVFLRPSRVVLDAGCIEPGRQLAFQDRDRRLDRLAGVMEALAGFPVRRELLSRRLGRYAPRAALLRRFMLGVSPRVWEEVV